jgi:hypothetical protein
MKGRWLARTQVVINRPIPGGERGDLTVCGLPTWLKLVHTVGADFDERGAEVVG